MGLILGNKDGFNGGQGFSNGSPDIATTKQINESLRTSLKKAYFTVEGRMFDRWIDTAGSRTAGSTGYVEGNLIENVAYVIESIYRDEIYSERDLQVTAKTSTTVFTCTDLKNQTDGYYVNAIYHNVTTGVKSYVTNYVGSTNTITINDADATIAAGNNFYLTNVDCDNRIDEASFDVLGNTTNGTRDGWIYRASINKTIKASKLLDQLCFEAFLIKPNSYGKVRLIALETGTAVATWGSPLKQNGIELAGMKLSPLENVYTEYRVKYAYDFGKNDYVKEYFVNKNGFTSGAALGTQQTACSNAETNYNVRRVLEYKCDYIYNDATARSLLIKLVNWFSKQRLQAVWYGSVKNFIQYEIGDIVKINYSALIPTGLNNASAFMVYAKTINTKKKIVLSFIEL